MWTSEQPGEWTAFSMRQMQEGILLQVMQNSSRCSWSIWSMNSPHTLFHSADCFNSDLGSHQSYCNTGNLTTLVKSNSNPSGRESPARIIICQDETKSKGKANDSTPERGLKGESFVYGVVEDIDSDDDDL